MGGRFDRGLLGCGVLPPVLLALACLLTYAIPMFCTGWVFTRHPDKFEEQGLLTLALMRRFGVWPGVALMFAGMSAFTALVWRFHPDELWILLIMFGWNAWSDVRELLSLRRTLGQSSSACHRRG